MLAVGLAPAAGVAALVRAGAADDALDPLAGHRPQRDGEQPLPGEARPARLLHAQPGGPQRAQRRHQHHARAGHLEPVAQGRRLRAQGDGLAAGGSVQPVHAVQNTVREILVAHLADLPKHAPITAEAKRKQPRWRFVPARPRKAGVPGMRGDALAIADHATSPHPPGKGGSRRLPNRPTAAPWQSPTAGPDIAKTTPRNPESRLACPARPWQSPTNARVALSLGRVTDDSHTVPWRTPTSLLAIADAPPSRPQAIADLANRLQQLGLN